MLATGFVLEMTSCSFHPELAILLRNLRGPELTPPRFAEIDPLLAMAMRRAIVRPVHCSVLLSMLSLCVQSVHSEASESTTAVSNAQNILSVSATREAGGIAPANPSEAQKIAMIKAELDESEVRELEKDIQRQLAKVRKVPASSDVVANIVEMPLQVNTSVH
jgi:hypothetical protein